MIASTLRKLDFFRRYVLCQRNICLALATSRAAFYPKNASVFGQSIYHAVMMIGLVVTCSQLVISLELGVRLTSTARERAAWRSKDRIKISAPLPRY